MELPPGHFMEIDSDGNRISRYWSLTFPAAGEELDLSVDDAAAELIELLSDAARLRLRADVPVAAYLSGGLDSTLIAALVRDQVPERLSTFSITFEERAFDESAHQRAAVEFLGTRHHHSECRNIDVGRVFPRRGLACRGAAPANFTRTDVPVVQACEWPWNQGCPHGRRRGRVPGRL
jgi:asparagine synthase (glutamine-hydrolysing)